MDAAGELRTGPTIGFPLGLILLCSMLFCMSLFFTCCLHWEKLQFLILLLRRPQSHDQNLITHIIHQDLPSSPHKFTPPLLNSKQNREASQQVVLMPGDKIPKFIALACPCEPPRLVAEKVITIQVQNPVLLLSQSYHTASAS